MARTRRVFSTYVNETVEYPFLDVVLFAPLDLGGIGEAVVDVAFRPGQRLIDDLGPDPDQRAHSGRTG